MILRILVGTDGSPRSLSSWRLAAVLARCTGASITLVHVLTGEVPPTTVAATPQAAGEEVLHLTRAHLGASALQVEERLVSGDPATEIIRVAEERDCDLIVLGSRRLTRMQRLLLGSVSRKVVEHAPCSVMIARPRRHRGHAPALPAGLHGMRNADWPTRHRPIRIPPKGPKGSLPTNRQRDRGPETGRPRQPAPPGPAGRSRRRPEAPSPLPGWRASAGRAG